jgi:uncharacterized protein YbbK (DUF523 family)
LIAHPENIRYNHYMNILISACLLGVPCRYDGCAKSCSQAIELSKWVTVIPVCPEQLGGFPTPRPPCELRNGQVITNTGLNVTAAYEQGARETLRLAQLLHCSYALLKERSPSCGCGIVHDGTFSGGLINGDGITAAHLISSGIRVFGESRCNELMCLMKKANADGYSSHTPAV